MGARKLSPAGFQHGDFGLFVDPGTPDAYIVYNSYDASGRNVIDRLSPDFTKSTGQNSGYLPMPGGNSGEAQAMLKRGDTYFAVFGHYCCFCAQGSGAVVHTAKSPLGPYRLTGTDIQRPEGADDHGGSALTIPAQQSFIVQLPPPMSSGSSGNKDRWMWGGDLWQSGNRIDGFKSDDSLVWVPLEFTPDGADIKSLNYNTTWQLEL